MKSNFRQVSTSLLFAQVISLVTYLTVANQFGPSTYGIYSVCLSVASFLLPLFTLRIDQSLYSKKTFRGALESHYFGLKFLYWCCLTFLILGMILVKVSPTTLDISVNDILLISVIVASLGIGNLHFSILVFAGKIRQVANWPVIQNISYFFSIIIFGSMSKSAFALVISLFVSRIVPSTIFKIDEKSLRIEKFRNNLKFHANFAQNWMPILVAICDQAIVSIPIIALGYIYGPLNAGVAALAIVILQAPSGFLSNSVNSTVLISILEENANRAQISLRLIRGYFLKFSIVIVFSYFLIISLSVGMSFVDLGKWSGINWVLSFQALPIFMMSAWIPLSSILQALSLWKLRSRIALLQLFAVFIPISFAIVFNLNWMFFVCQLSVINFFSISLSCWFAYRGIARKAINS